MVDQGVGPNRFDESLVDFFARFASSAQFTKVFKEGMGLVEETANYLDGPGRLDARLLDRHGAIAYATESMRLTTRLMQLASWLLLQRAVSAKELTPDEASREKHRISLTDIGAGHTLTGSEQLPDGLRALIKRSLKLHDRILKLDAMITARAYVQNNGDSPVNTQIDQLAQVLKVARSG